ncbi:TPA: hypothetical protein HIQ47_004572, partial [Escherichia coli]|nr:hypothetical protein [Escherichia coli]HAH9213727.1 hypothetical protein [Escherichia coli]
MFFSGLFQRKSDAPVTTPAELADAIGLSYDTYTRQQDDLNSLDELQTLAIDVDYLEPGNG